MRAISTILFLLIFQAAVIIMPYGNFDDNYALRILYHDLQNEDPDLNVSEFIFEKLLVFGHIFEEKDDDIPIEKQAPPTQPLQIQQGHIVLSRVSFMIQDEPVEEERTLYYFKENNYSEDFSPSIFHPPAIAA